MGPQSNIFQSLQVENYADRLALFTLSQICYPEDDLVVLEQSPNTSKFGGPCPFLPPGPTEIAKLLWIDGKAVGFYTLKEKGMFLQDNLHSSVFHSRTCHARHLLILNQKCRKRQHVEKHRTFSYVLLILS